MFESKDKKGLLPVGFIGLGKYLPEKVLTNHDLERMVDTSDEWIATRTGIKERRVVSNGMVTSDLGARASEAAIARAGLRPEEVDLIVVATITPDMPFPATSCLIQEKLGAKRAACFDVSAACSGFIHALTIAKQFIAAGTYKNALVVGAETLSTIVDWKDRNTCVLFGDGAGAAVMAPVSEGGILSTYLGSDGGYGELLMIPGGGARFPASEKTIREGLHYMRMNGGEVFKLAVRAMTESVERIVRENGFTMDQITCLIPHQANVRIIEAMAERLGYPLSKIYLNLNRYGNMSSASTVTALCEAVEEGRVKRGDLVVLVAVGGGLVWGSCLVRW
ncbi:MAG: ketoacyl-ACP synthase III [Candidatus Omnitrophica bacterium]|nr:ketoacyl-ACP synthase III [Candidatus Omnitrophota bacterium]